MSATVMPPGRARRMSPGAGTRGRGASALGKARELEAAEGGFLGGGDACPVHDTAQNPFQDVMAQRGMCSEGRAPHSVVSLGGAKVGATVALHGKGVGGQRAEAEAEAGVDFPALEFKSRSAGESVEPGRGGRQEQLSRRTRALPCTLFASRCIVELVERVETGLGLVPCEDAQDSSRHPRHPGIYIIKYFNYIR
jgi:hypothetical protein